MSKQKFKKGDNVLVIKGTYKGMRGVIDDISEDIDRVRYIVSFESFITYLYSYQMKLDVVEGSAAIKHVTESIDRLEKSKMKPGSHVMLSKRGLAKIAVDGESNSGRSYNSVCNHNLHTIYRVDTFGGINFYVLTGFVNNYHFTEEDLLPIEYRVGEKVRFTRETLVKLGVELSEYYGKDTIDKLPQDITDVRRILSICCLEGKVLYQLEGNCFGKLFYGHEIELAND